MTGMRRVRIDSGSWPVEDDVDNAEETCGEQLQWGLAIPWAFRALHVPRSAAVMPAPPGPGDDISSATVYWAPLMHLLAYSFAWTRPFRGLHRWYDEGRPVHDQRFSLISDVWGTDRQLDWFYAWMWDHDPDWTEMFEGIADIAYFAGSIVASRPNPIASEMNALKQSADAAKFATPLAGGSDPLHLGAHWSGPLDQASTPSLIVRTGRSERTAVLLAHGMKGWYRQLAARAVDLPSLTDRSWHVEVVVKPAGWLGTYRRSRVTGLWFAGPHSIHMYGN